MGSAVLFIFRSRLLLYTARSVVNRVQVVLSGYSVRLLCFVQANNLCRYGCMYFLAELIRLVYVGVMVMSPVCQDLVSCYFTLFYYLLDLSCGECIALLVYLFVVCVACLTVFVNCLVKQFAICFSCYCVVECYGCV